MRLAPDPLVTPEDVERGKPALVKDAAWASLVGSLYGGVILVGECCDPYSVEAVRATMGSIFAVPLTRASEAEFAAWRRAWPPTVRRYSAPLPVSRCAGRIDDDDTRPRLNLLPKFTRVAAQAGGPGRTLQVGEKIHLAIFELGGRVPNHVFH